MSNMRFGAGGGPSAVGRGRKVLTVQFSNISPARWQPHAHHGLYAGGGDPVFSIQSLPDCHRRIPGAIYPDDDFSRHPGALGAWAIFYLFTRFLHQHVDARTEDIGPFFYYSD